MRPAPGLADGSRVGAWRGVRALAVLEVSAGWRHRLGEGRKLGQLTIDAVMVCVCGLDSHTEELDQVFLETWLNPALVMTLRPSADELTLADKDNPGTQHSGCYILLLSGLESVSIPILFK